MTEAEPAGEILVASGHWDHRPWAEEVRARLPGRTVRAWPDIPDPQRIAYVLAWRPPEGLFARLPAVRAIFSLGAGVDHLIFRDDLPDVPIARIVDPDLTGRMTEWTVLQVLLHHRRQREYDRLKRERTWFELEQPAAHQVRVGVMGMGVMGRDAASALLRLGFQVAGWSRSPSNVAGVASFHDAAGLDPFLRRTDILVALLPLTADTRGLLAMPLFEKLGTDGKAVRKPVLVNAGRGGLQVEADIVRALEAGVLAGASLDVFEQEPLDPASPLWGFESVVITPHAAGWSSPRALAARIARQIEGFEQGRPLENLVDPSAGY